ncbi:hypothetical protein [Pararhodospirillum photometricum]|uniref:Uncharacterized protein n=1 Tax=Pararhodospirillum photometricum DSM 122 TaxID=1150469 RepID=H6SR86_PARPM|nr:hypothetical protein [Pararhodospirillum photometricum]CCG09808.1 unnamed protein product [Pararhodospirillum photometricum DSM 122]
MGQLLRFTPANDNGPASGFLEPLDRLRLAVDGLLDALDRQVGALEALHGSCQDLETIMTACDTGLASLCETLAKNEPEAPPCSVSGSVTE